MAPATLIWIVLVTLVIMSPQTMVHGANVGINYGRLGDDLPAPRAVIEFLANDLKYAAPMVRLFDPHVEALQTLLTTNLSVSLGVSNQDVSQMASSMDFTRQWLGGNVFGYNPSPGFGVKFRYITVGNELIPGPDAQNVLPAMKNIYQALSEKQLSDSIKVSTVVNGNVLGTSYPPSAGQFSDDAANVMNDVTNFLYGIGAPLLINVYPYFAYASDPDHVRLDYALFQSQTPVVPDGNLSYYNLFDAMVDAFVAAMIRAVGQEDVKLVVSESGWPSAGNDPYSSIDNARNYNNNLKKHIQNGGGTPRRPDLNLDTFIFSMFNENQKPPGIEQNFGNFYPNLTEVYPLWR